MRFDLIANFSPGETIPWTRSLEMILEQCSLAEAAGFTTAWFTEHHFAHNGYMNAPPNPIQMCTHVAAHCKKLRVGTAPIVLPDWHPLRVAEDVAMLDNMTLGRVDFGVAKGINERATIQFNRVADRRDNSKAMRLYQESLEIILKAWTNEAFTHKGEFYQFPVPGWYETNRFFEPLDPRYHDADGEYKAIYVHPRPVQKDHPPVWLMSNAPPTFKLAGERGWGVISMSSGVKQTLASWEPYREALSEREGREVQLGEVSVCAQHSMWVKRWKRRSTRSVRQSTPIMNSSAGRGLPVNGRSMVIWILMRNVPREDEVMDWFDFLNKRGIIVVGDAEFVADRFAEKQESFGLDHVMLMQQYTGVSYEKILASWDRLFEHVVPKFGTQSKAQKRG